MVLAAAQFNASNLQWTHVMRNFDITTEGFEGQVRRRKDALGGDYFYIYVWGFMFVTLYS
jgi:hypothetical protein